MSLKLPKNSGNLQKAAWENDIGSNDHKLIQLKSSGRINKVVVYIKSLDFKGADADLKWTELA